MYANHGDSAELVQRNREKVYIYCLYSGYLGLTDAFYASIYIYISIHRHTYNIHIDIQYVAATVLHIIYYGKLYTRTCKTLKYKI